MDRRKFKKIVVRSVAIAIGLCAVVAAAMTATMVWRGGTEGGLTAAARVLRHGTTTVYDFKLYPSRPLRPSPTPAPFKNIAAVANAPPVIQSGAARGATLAEVLAANHTLAFLVIKDDAIVFESYAPGHGVAALSMYFSVTKSILATLVGMALDDGVLRSIDQPVTDYVPELAGHGFASVTLRQLINMTSSLDYVENDNPFGLHVLMNYTSRLEDLILSFGLRGSAANRFEYRSGETALLSLALQRALGSVSLTSYAQQKLWKELGMEHAALWSLDREGGFERAWCCIAGTARDLAKVGRLYLARGMHGDQRLLSERWLEQALPRPSADGSSNARAYTFSWWPGSPLGADYMALGKDGQFLYVDPSRQTIVVRLGESTGRLSRAEWVSLFTTVAAHPW